MSENFPPTMCLDGTAIRRIREEKKLTQLYVAKVVGVTTDTVSRWENNRYPSIKRENVLRLAEALEVPVADILLAPAEEEPVPQVTEGRRKWLLPLILAVVIAFLLALAFLLLRDSPVAGITAERRLPPFAAPGSVLPVRVVLSIDEEEKGFVLREHFPAGWNLIEAQPKPSSVDEKQGTVRWLIRSGQPLAMAYLLQVPLSATAGEKKFQGDVIAGNENRPSPVPIGGGDSVTVSTYLWADTNGDRVIDDSEMLQASYLFDELEGKGLDWKLLEEIWDAGGYRWDPERQVFSPLAPPAQ